MTRADYISEKLGSRNWIIAKRTKNVLRRHGDDVVCISSKRYAEIQKAYEMEHDTIITHAAFELLLKWLGAGRLCDAVNTIKMLRENGFRIEPVREET